jgi:TolA-binding protein
MMTTVRAAILLSVLASGTALAHQPPPARQAAGNNGQSGQVPANATASARSSSAERRLQARQAAGNGQRFCVRNVQGRVNCILLPSGGH